MLERLNKELERRTAVATLIPNEASLVRLVSAVLAEISEEWETGRTYLGARSRMTFLGAQSSFLARRDDDRVFEILEGGAPGTPFARGAGQNAKLFSSGPLTWSRSDHPISCFYRKNVALPVVAARSPAAGRCHGVCVGNRSMPAHMASRCQALRHHDRFATRRE